MSPATASAPRLQLVGITKRYPAVVANDAVSLSVQPGQAHAILGENGAGKSTLMKIIYGSTQPDAGQVLFDGQPVQIRNPQQARQLGIAMVFQHFSLFDTLTVAQNVWLGLDKSLSLAEVTQRMIDKGRQYGLELDPQRPVHTLSVGEMQRVEIVRALLANPRLLILDEPTSVLTPQAVEQLFVVLRQLVSEGCSILYISHKLHEIRALCTACTVLRGGKVTGVCQPQNESNASLSRLMIGAEPAALEHRPAHTGDVVLQVRDLLLPRQDAFGVDLIDVSLQVRSGEVVGIAGVSGNGQTELLKILSGEIRANGGGSITLCGDTEGSTVEYSHKNYPDPAQLRLKGVGHVPEDRLGQGLLKNFTMQESAILGYDREPRLGTRFSLIPKKVKALTLELIRAFVRR